MAQEFLLPEDWADFEVRGSAGVSVVVGGMRAVSTNRTAPRKVGTSVPTPTPSADGPEEITIDEDMDLKELAELARRIEQRTP